MKDERQDKSGRKRDPEVFPVEEGDKQEFGRPETDPEEAIGTATWLFWEYVRDLRAKREAISASDWDSLDGAELKRATETAKTVRQAIHLLMEERQKLEKYRKNISGGGGSGLDLDAARDEIGRRLACLRRAGAG